MKHALILLLATLSWLLPAAALSPLPSSMTMDGGSMTWSPSPRIFYATRNTARPVENSLQPLAEVLAGELEAVTGVKPAILPLGGGSTPGNGDISLEFAPLTGAFAATEDLEDQSYSLVVANSVTIRSQYYKGVAYGTATLVQSLVESGGSFTVPKVTIADSPAAAYRSVMLDLARQPSSLGTVKEVIRLARLHKLRYLHLHLTDDQHFTFPFPPVTDHLSGNILYPRAELEELVAYADARGITIIPELDLPGHSSRLKESGYLNPGGTDADVAHPDNYAKIQAIVDEMLEVFYTSPYFHIGGDESGAGSALIPFLRAMNLHLRSKPEAERKRLMIWEGFHGSPTVDLPATGPDRVVIFSWESSYNPPWDLLNSGYQVINASWKPMYIVGSGATNRGPHTTQRMWSPEIIHGWDKDTFMHWEPGRPVFEDAGPSDPNKQDGKWDVKAIGREAQVLGGQMLSWEQNEKTILRDLLPRLPAMADRLWNPVGTENYPAFAERLESVRERVLTIVQPVEILPADTDPGSPLSADYRSYAGSQVAITLRNRTKIPGTIRYETGGFNNSRTTTDFHMVPQTTAASPAYSGPITRSGGFGIRARLHRPDGTPVEGHDWQHYNNWQNVVRVTEYEVPRKPLAVVPDFASYTSDKILRSYDLPVLRGPYVLDRVYGQMFRATLSVPGTGSYDLSMQTSDGRSSVYIDRNRNGIWEPTEKLIADSPGNDTPVHVNVQLEQGDYQLRVDHASGAIGPILWLKLNGPGTSGAKDVTDYLSLPIDANAPPATPQLTYPLNGATGYRSSLPLSWTSAGAASYSVYLWPQGSPKPATATAGGLTTGQYAPANLSAATTYRWTVTATNPNGTVESSEATFTTADSQGPAASIGWKYLGLGGISLAASDLAGAPGYQQVYWNNHQGSGQAPGSVPLVLKDSDGQATTARVTSWTQSSNNSWKHDDGSTPDRALTNDFANREAAITFTGIPYSGYDVVVYYGNNEGPSTSTLHAGNRSRTIRTGNTAQSFHAHVGYVEGTDASAATPSNYSVFEGLSGQTLVVSLSGANNNGISAIQIIEGEPVPESTTPATPSHPANGSSGMKPWQPLAWNAGGAGETGYDVYLWKDGENKPGSPTGSTDAIRFHPHTYLEASRAYRWQIVTRLQSGGTLTSGEFTFTTGTLAGEPPFDVSPAAREPRTAGVEAMKGIAALVSPDDESRRIPDGTRLAFFGDSITDVFTYFDGIADALQQASDADPDFPEVTILNRGINGATSDDLLNLPDGDQFSGGSGPNPPRPFAAQVDADLAALPDGAKYVAVIQIGINDVYQGDNTSKATYKARLDAMTAHVLGKGHHVVLVSPTVIGESPIADITNDGRYDDAGNQLLNQYVEALEEIATARGIPVVNQREAYLNLYRNENVAIATDAAGTVTYPATTGILNSDVVHPNARGKALSSELVARGIAQLFSAVAAPPAQPSPADGAARVPLNPDLSWNPVIGATSYDVYFWTEGESKPAAPTHTGATATFSPGLLPVGTAFHWQVVAHTEGYSLTGPVWTFTTRAALPATIGWKYVGWSGVPLPASASAGAPGHEQSQWNNHAGFGQGPGSVPFPLVDGTGAATTASITAWTQSQDNSWHHGQTDTPDETLLNDFNDREPAITFSGIPYETYNVVVYYGNNEGPSTSTLSLTAQDNATISRTITTGNTSTSSHRGVGYVEETGANSGPTNYTVFTGVSAPQLRIALSGANNNGICAIQIVESFPPLEGFTAWLANTPGAGSGPESNTDGDAWPDLVEYALGGDPATGVAPVGLPALSTTSGTVSLSYLRPLDRGDILYELQGSTTGQLWHLISDIAPVVSSQDGMQSVTYPDLRGTADVPGLASSLTAFFRLRFTLQ
ncbi:family 20 glycosylhydrolase [Luteolibacter flavescens]|uniref:beta-N-acetylhexosaminidase n=1 Tax=Luteolibacter flavescens TaxID=1859460 RepID=A0ABT3FSW9_9BACT|nr:family 20 glycosylhydrolase [Luteolibacter flavescens]MCW1886681.1 family 20 glycosylhydrolase [Luteolibacter flavescens]